MKDFKDTTKTHYVSGQKACGGAVRGAAKVSSAMREFKTGPKADDRRTYR